MVGSPTTQRALAMALLGAAALAAGAAIVLPVLRVLDTAERMTVQLATLASIQRAMSTNGGIVTTTPTNVLVTSESTGRATAELQQRITDLAAAAGVKVRSVQALATRRQNDLLHIPLDIGMQADSGTLAAYIHAVETGLPLFLVDELNIQVIPAPTGSDPRATQLSVELKVRGLAVSGDAEKPK